MLISVSPLELCEAVQTLYENGLPAGSQTGWKSLDEFYTVAPGYWTVITGMSSEGKSTFMDCLMLNLMRQGWKFVVYSPESQPIHLHLALLCQKLCHRPFRKGYNNRLDTANLAKAMSWLDERLRILKFDDGASFPDLEQFCSAVDYSLESDFDTGKVGVVLDPWNEIDHESRTSGMTETQITNHELMKYRQWVRKHDERMHGFIIAHPSKPQKDKDNEYKPAKLYDISGSAAWKNKCDFGIIVRRHEDRAEIEVEKVRWGHLGKKGTCYLAFNSGTENFYDEEYGERSQSGSGEVED